MNFIYTHFKIFVSYKILILISLDFVGNTTYEIYNKEKDLQNQDSNL